MTKTKANMFPFRIHTASDTESTEVDSESSEHGSTPQEGEEISQSPLSLIGMMIKLVIVVDTASIIVGTTIYISIISISNHLNDHIMIFSTFSRCVLIIQGGLCLC